MTVVEEAFEYLRAPVMRITGRDTPIPFADSIEKGVWPEAEDFIDAVHQIVKW
jgi:pyruvate dehydrogenase E1 component beta subunit